LLELYFALIQSEPICSSFPTDAFLTSVQFFFIFHLNYSLGGQFDYISFYILVIGLLDISNHGESTGKTGRENLNPVLMTKPHTTLCPLCHKREFHRFIPFLADTVVNLITTL